MSDSGGKVVKFPDLSALRFEIYTEDEEEQGLFVEPRTAAWDELTEQFDELLGDADRGDVTYAEYEKQCRQIVKKHPQFLDAYAHAGMIHLPPHLEDEVSAAARWYRKGFKIAQEIIPEGYSGKIEWAHLSNRPFLRVHHGLILCALRQGKINPAIKLMEQHLSWNPNDNIGVRYILGDAYLTIPFRWSEAREHLRNIADEYPPARYSLGLLEFAEGNLIPAITSLRKGIAENPYIAEAITGRIALEPHPYWHSSSHDSPSTAGSYLELLGEELWEKNLEAIEFLDWLFASSKCLKERAAYTEIREELTTEHEYNNRRKILNRLSELDRAISDRTSETWLNKVKTRSGQEVWPWEIEDHKTLNGLGNFL